MIDVSMTCEMTLVVFNVPAIGGQNQRHGEQAEADALQSHGGAQIPGDGWLGGELRQHESPVSQVYKRRQKQ